MEKMNDIAKTAISDKLAKAIKDENLTNKQASHILQTHAHYVSMILNRKHWDHCVLSAWHSAQKWCNSGLSLNAYAKKNNITLAGSAGAFGKQGPLVPAPEPSKASDTTDAAAQTPQLSELAVIWENNIERLGKISIEDAIKYVKEAKYKESFTGVLIVQLNVLYTAKMELKEERF